jgi:dimethylaniline monooxygenase (N-oxide forming)
MKLIGIIGAGISGLAAAKAFMEQGYEVVLLEKAGSLGGVWEKSRFYIGMTTQTTKNEYAFSDFPMPAHYPEWPSGLQVRAYLENYADHFGILEHIQFNIEVLDMRHQNDSWIVETRNEDGMLKTYSFDFVTVCTGTFHEKHIPAITGMKQYLEAGGKILHSSEIRDESILNDKHVAVVGFAKSASDIATRAAEISKSSTLLYRKAQWKVPRFFGNKINLKYLLFSRFSEAFFLPYSKTGFQKFLHSIGKPMVWLQWRGIELLLKKQFKLKACGMVPSHKIDDQISCSLGIAPIGFYEYVRTKKIKAVCTEIDYFKNKEVVLKTGAKISPDLIVFGTGFKQTLPFLNKEYQQLLRDETGMFKLYRNIINPKVPNLAFVGFNSSLFSTLTSEIAANWLAHYVNGDITLPDQQSIDKEVEKIAKWKCNTRPISSEFSGLCVAPFNFQHLDELMKDMKLKSKASNNPIYEFFKPINPKDYQKLLNRRKIVKQKFASELIDSI